MEFSEPTGRTVTCGFGELDMQVPAHAAIIHKSQSSEYPAVVRRPIWRHDALLDDSQYLDQAAMHIIASI